ncbi:MAG: ABC transporter transmembrane domain-containing protein, partial [Bacilli bacterium]
MFKLIKKLRKCDWVMIAIIMALTVLQVWCVMLLTDYMMNIISDITYLSYQTDPSQMGEEFNTIFQGMFAGSWQNMDAAISEGTLPMITEEMAATIHSIAIATTNDVWFHGGMMILVVVGYTGVQIIISVLASIIAAHFATSVRHDVNKKVSSFSLSNIHSFSTPSLITRASNDIEQVQMTLLLMMRMVFAAPVTAIWAICKIQASSFELTITTVIAVLALIVGLVIIMIVVFPKFNIVQKSIDKLNEVSRENLKGIRVVRAYNGEKYQEAKFNTANDNLKKLNKFTGRANGLMSPLMTILMDGVSLAIYLVGAHLINDSKISYAEVAAFMSLATQVIMAFMMLLIMMIMWPRASVSAKRINEVLESSDSIVDPETETVPTEKGTIEFKNVAFRYPDAEENVIENVSFKAKTGDTIAVIGSTGCGKSSLINLISRFYDCTEGEILVDGVNVRELKQKTLHHIVG